MCKERDTLHWKWIVYLQQLLFVPQLLGAKGIATRSKKETRPERVVTKGSPLGDTLSLSCEASVGESGSNN